MEEKEQLCTIPRNLNKPDVVINSPIPLNWKQITYIGIGVAGTYLAFQTAWPIIYKVIAISGSVSISLITSLVKYEDSTIDDLVIDGLHFVQKKNIYNQIEKKGGINVRIGTYKDETKPDFSFF